MGAHQGESHHKAKLTDEKVREILELRAQGLSYQKICEAIGWEVTLTPVRKICEGIGWKHVKRNE